MLRTSNLRTVVACPAACGPYVTSRHGETATTSLVVQSTSMERLSANALVDWNGSILQTALPCAKSARGVCQEIAAIPRAFLEKPGFRLSPELAGPPRRQPTLFKRGNGDHNRPLRQSLTGDRPKTTACADEHQRNKIQHDAPVCRAGASSPIRLVLVCRPLTI
jgi:hypothetical protein